MTIRFEMTEASDGVPFVTPNAAVAHVPRAELIGKPIMVLVFPGQFSPGNDPPLYVHWGEVPEDLRYEHKTPGFSHESLDVTLVIYNHSEITPEIRESPQFAPVPQGGDISSLSFTEVREGEQSPTPGLIRVYLDEETRDAEIVLANRTPKDPTNMADVGQSFTDTLMLLP